MGYMGFSVGGRQKKKGGQHTKPFFKLLDISPLEGWFPPGLGIDAVGLDPGTPGTSGLESVT